MASRYDQPADDSEVYRYDDARETCPMCGRIIQDIGADYCSDACRIDAEGDDNADRD